MRKKLSIALAGITLILYGFHANYSFLSLGDNKLYDNLQILIEKFSPRVLDTNAVVVIDIDDDSLERLGQWPWPRIMSGKLVEAIAREKPAAIAIDILFPEHDRTSINSIQQFYKNFFNFDLNISGIPEWLYDNDAIFSDSLNSAKVTMPVYLQNVKKSNTCKLDFPYNVNIFDDEVIYTGSSMLCNIKEIQSATYSTGFINASLDKDGIFRRMPLIMRYQEQNIASLSLAAVLSSGLYDYSMEHEKTLIGAKTTFAKKSVYTDQHSNVLLRFYSREQYLTIPAYKILTGDFDPKDLQGKYALIGTTATGLHDHYIIGSGELIPGIFMHATLLENFFNDEILSQPEILKNINLILSFLLAMLTIYMMYLKRFMMVVFLFIGSIVSSLAVTIFALINNYYLSTGYFLVSFSNFIILISIAFAIISYMQRKRFFEKLSHSHQATLESMALVAETRDTDTGAHILRTKEYIKALAKYLATKEKYKLIITEEYIEAIYHAAPLHDIGKVGIPDSILNKPGKLDFDEFKEMKNHSMYGNKILENAKKRYESNLLLDIAQNIAYFHHEKWDGSGYPNGLSGESIPLEARLMAVSDVYDALINKRCYKPSFSYEDAEGIIIKDSSTHFDPEIVEAFIALKSEFRAIAEHYTKD